MASKDLGSNFISTHKFGRSTLPPNKARQARVSSRSPPLWGMDYRYAVGGFLGRLYSLDEGNAVF